MNKILWLFVVLANFLFCPFNAKADIIFQPGPEGKDACVKEGIPDTNYNDKILGTGVQVTPNRGNNYSLIQFELNGLPSNVASAILRLRNNIYLRDDQGGFYITGVLNAHRITESWNETSVTWTTMPSYVADAGAQSTQFNVIYDEWIEVNITSLYNAWKSGTPNFGLMLNTDGSDTVGPCYGNKEWNCRPGSFYSSDYADNPEYRPVLLIKTEVDNDSDGYTENQGDCNDSNSTIHPGATDICGDGIDQDCSGSDCLPPNQTDDDGDGYTENQGDCNDSNSAIHPGATDICGDGIDQDCSGSDCLPPNQTDDDGDGYTENQGDCNDANATIHPGATEICDDGIDQDCNGSDCSKSNIDDDGDGYTENQGDCNDANATIHPGATEICDDGIDQDCNGSDCSKSNIDDDGDGYTENQGDCNDANATIHPGATEICDDGIDQDCNGSDCSKSNIDDDGDGYTENQGDCNDSNSTIYPGAKEIYDDGVDQDCNGSDAVHQTTMDGGYNVTSELWSKAVLKVPGNPITLIWKMVGTDITLSGDQVISGYFFADPLDFAYGSPFNPEVFIKIYIASNGWANIAFNHVTVDNVEVFSSHSDNDSNDQSGTIWLEERLIEHTYTGVSIDSDLIQSNPISGIPQNETLIDDGYVIKSNLWAKAILHTPGLPVTLVWKTVGADITPTGDRVVSGYFYADPSDFAYGSEYNPEVFVKIFIATNGWANMAYNHVTVDNVSIYSAHQYSNAPESEGWATLSNRLQEHPYNDVSIDDTDKNQDNDDDGFSENQGDCNDSNAIIYPGATEICDDGVDQDCNGSDKDCGSAGP